MATEEANKLINEATRRILLDTIIRGHGDKLIGRWSSDPQIQKFLKQVPYMLDRINQLHLVCSRVDQSDADHLHSHHRHASSRENGAGSIDSFLAIVSSNMHWLVRSRDPLGLTPLHKAVLHLNRPIVEYIVDRYNGELAAMPSCRPDTRRSLASCRLIDAQDKYGRTPLHYAAAMSSAAGTKESSHRRASLAKSIFNFLVARGASLQLRDFRGKQPSYYARHANHINAKSVIHLAAKLNASFQANVLSKTLGATNEPTGLAEHNLLDVTLDSEIKGRNSCDRLASSLSCSDIQRLDESCPADTRGARRSSNLEVSIDTLHQDPPSSQEDSACHEKLAIHEEPVEQLGKWLVSERCPRPVLSQATRLRIKRSLEEGVAAKISELLVEGYGEPLVEAAATSCWNQQCRRYVSQLIPRLLSRLDELHESVADNRIDRALELIAEEPILARIRRPYKRAALNCLHLAAWLNRRRLVECITSGYPELICTRDSRGATCLHWAAKSLAREPLYLWLQELYGRRLEHLRDERGKSAADYRQQAIRSLSITGNAAKAPSACKPVASDPHELLRQAKIESQEVRLTVTKSIITNRRPKAAFCHTSAAEHTPQPSACNNPIQLSDKEEALKALEKHAIGSVDGSSRTTEASPARGCDSPETSSEQMDRAKLLDQMVKIDLEDTASENSSLLSDSSKTPSISSVGTRKRFSIIVEESIAKCDLRKLEHLVLAGCGPRLMSTISAKGELLEKPAHVLRKFLSTELPKLVSTVSDIHRALHLCVSHSKETDFDTNANYYRFTSLLVANSLIVARDANGASALHVALLRNDSRLVKYLLCRYPAVASGPDRRGRVSAHYAALTMAAHRHHGDFRLSPPALPSGFWQVDDGIETTNLQLKSRFPLITELKDGAGLTADDYVQEIAGRKHDEELHLESCCKEYAELLAIYGYRIHGQEEDSFEPEESRREYIPTPESRSASSRKVLRMKESSRAGNCKRRANSCDRINSSGRRRDLNRGLRSQTADDLLLHSETNSYAGFDNKETDLRLANSNGKATKHNSGEICRSAEPYCRKKRYHRRLDQFSSRVDMISPIELTGKLFKRLPANHQMHIGGIIVPTIIHSDEMNEIETYDIVYRTPRPVLSVSRSSQQTVDISRAFSGDDLTSESSNGNLVIRNPGSVDDSEYELPENGGRSSDHPGGSMSDDEWSEQLLDNFTTQVAEEALQLRTEVDQLMARFAKDSPESGSHSIGDHMVDRPQWQSQADVTSLAKSGGLIAKNSLGQTYLHFVTSRPIHASTLFRILDREILILPERDVFYRTARDVSAQCNMVSNIEVLDKFIIDLFVSSDTKNLRYLFNEGYSPLIHVADSNGNDIMLILKLLRLDQMVHFLLQLADLQRWRDELHTFIRHGYSAGVTKLVGRHSDLVRAKSVFSRSSIHLAVLFDRPEMVKDLLAADPMSARQADNMGRQPLHYCYGLSLKNGHEIRTELLASGADHQSRDHRQRTPHYYAFFPREIEEIRQIELELN